MGKLNELMKRLGHVFEDPELLQHALTHRSAGSNNNERLEFLGDAVLGFIIASELYARHPEAQEGDLSRLRAFLVNGERLAMMAKNLGISNHLNLGMGERKSGGKKRESILADAFEAIVGAIYMDGGLEVCRARVLSWYGRCVDDLSKLTPVKDPKSRLQEWLQARKFPLPDYKVAIKGEAHAQIFTITCSVEGLPHSTEGVGKSRRKAEQIAAQHFLDLLDE